MKITKFFVAQLILLSFVMYSASAAEAPYSVKITAPSEVFHVGEEVHVKITVTNTSNQPITLVETSHVCDYIIEVRDETGKLVPDTPFKRQHGCIARPSASGRNMLVPLQQGESYDLEISLSELSDITLPGRYSVQIQRKDKNESANSVAKSNILTIAVLPADDLAGGPVMK